MFHFAIAKIGIHLPVCFLLSEIFCLWIWHAIAKRYIWWLFPQNIWNKSNNNLICKSNNLTAASLKRKYWAGSAHEQWGWRSKLASKPWSSATLQRNSRANFVARQLFCMYMERAPAHGCTPEQSLSSKWRASNEQEAGATPSLLWARAALTPPPVYCVPLDTPVYPSMYPCVYPGIADPRPHYEDLAKNFPAASPDLLQMAPVLAFLQYGEPIFGQISKVGACQKYFRK